MRSIIKHWWNLTFSYPQSTIESKPLSYDEYWESRGRKEVNLSPWQKKRSDIVLSFIKQSTPTIVDVGCGDGSVLDYLNKKLGGIKGIGVDVSKPALNKVKELGFEAIHVDFSNVEQLNIPSTDYTILFEIIEHIKDSELLVKKAIENSKSGVFISIPNSGFFVYRFRLLFGKFPAQWVLQPNEHLRFWTLRDVKWWLKANNWKDKSKIATYEGVPFLNKMIPSWFAAGIVIYISS